MPPAVQHRRGTLAALTAANEIPFAGQIYFESDTNKLKVGDGVTAYNSLPYIVGGAATGVGVSAINAVLDSLTFNGATTTFNLTIGSVAATPNSAASLLIVLNGVVQRPGVSYTVSGSQITFSVAPAATDSFFGVFLAGNSAIFSSPATLTSDQHNYSLATGASHVRLANDGIRTITGFVATAGASVTLHNTGISRLFIAHESASSAPANRVISPTGSDFEVRVNSSVTLTYDATSARWRATAVVRSVIDQWWAASADKTKLDGIATGATANATDAQLRDRSTHTGTQAISTVTGLQTALDGKQDSGSYAAAVHTHTIANVTGLQTALDGKQAAGSYAASTHSHIIGDVTGLQTALDGKQASGSYAASTHTHTIANVTGLQAALDGKQVAGSYATLVGGRVPAEQLPSYVDDVIEKDNFSQLPASGEEGKIYITINDSKLWRWGGTVYVQVGGSGAGGGPANTDALSEGTTNLYFTSARATSAVQSQLDAKAALVHTHVIANVTGLQSALDNKAALSHSHVVGDVTGLQAALDGKQATGSYASATHTHIIADVTGLQAALDGKQASGSYASATHSHAASDITSGVISVSRLGTGTPSSTTFLRGDGSWQTPASGGATEIYEFTSTAGFPAIGSAASLYIDKDRGRVFRWETTVYVEVGPVGGGFDSRWDLFLPPAPTGLTATAGNSQVILAWTAPTVLAQTPITDYIVQSSTNSGSTWTTVSDGTSTNTSVTVTGLTNGTAYVFRVAAVNGVGQGAYTAATESVTPGDVFRAIPAMTSNTEPSGVASGTPGQWWDANVWQAFDQNSATSVYIGRAPSNTPRRRIQYAFPDGQKSRITGYSISLNDVNGDAIPRNWNFYGSDDLSAWTLLESRTDSVSNSFGQWFGTSIAIGQARSFALPAAANYRAYRWVFSEDIDSSDGPMPQQISLLP